MSFDDPKFTLGVERLPTFRSVFSRFDGDHFSTRRPGGIEILDAQMKKAEPFPRAQNLIVIGGQE
jgi:hypothetical protein